MRFKKVDVAPSGKKQYLIALGRVDIELLLGEARNAERYLPATDELKPIKQRLKGICEGLNDALAQAKADATQTVPAPPKQEVDKKGQAMNQTSRGKLKEVI